MSISYIFHKGKKIMFIDYTKCKTAQETIDLLEKVRQEYLKTNEKIIALNDFRDAYGSNEYMKRANQLAKELFDERTYKNAAIGVTGIKKILLNGYNVFVKHKIMPFNTKEEALDWLAND
jgi:hypothetical protein